ncbi:antitoxin VbhA family protein [Microbacterium sp. W1N]|uniref:antitoxin VbhA family protein n=1 Tax=Microbacterium festucae TaxID=2977531 RepID=UPI0021BFF5A4|nr:antitoxin VbhA family protein [Microbacterium festucae]MCT9819303.1 antitoxin VbhA family protein [Microbacterium festucae]
MNLSKRGEGAMNTTRSVVRARSTDRARNIYSATVAENLRLSDRELLDLIEGRPDTHSGAVERARVEMALSEYDRAVDALASGVTPIIAGVELATRSVTNAVQQAIERASEVALGGAPVHSVVNALNVTLIGAGAAPVAIERATTTALLKALVFARNGKTNPFELFVLKLTGSDLGDRPANPPNRAERARAVEEAFASWALEGLSPDERDLTDARNYVDGLATGSDLVARLKAEYGVK